MQKKLYFALLSIHRSFLTIKQLTKHVKMKQFRNVLLLAATIVLSLSAGAQTADEIVNKYITAIGGAENWKKVNSVTSEGSLTVQGADVAVSMTVLNGKGMRQNISVMGMTGYSIMTPTGGWNFMPFQGQQKPEPATEETVKESADQYDTQGALVDYKSKGHSIEYLGKEDVEGTEAHKVKVTHKSGKVETMYFDPTSFLAIRTVSKQKANGQESEITTSLSNYKKLPEGILVPMSVSVPVGPGMSAELTITKVEINKPVDEAIFKPSN
jgi:hypothetical protein